MVFAGGRNVVKMDLVNKKFNKLLVLEKLPKRGKHGEIYWSCRCDCGNLKTVRCDALRKNKIKSCGCLLKVNLTGKVFGYLTVIGRSSLKNKYGKVYWDCSCKCGGSHILTTERLTSGSAHSCGCKNLRRSKDNPHFTGYQEISGNLWFRIKDEAKRRGIQFNVTLEEVWDLFVKQGRKCKLTGLDLTFGKSSKDSSRTTSLDRIDSQKGYDIANLQWVHKDINWMKNRFNNEYFIKMCTLVSKTHGG